MCESNHMRNASTTIRDLWRRARRLCRVRLRSKRTAIALLLLIVLMPGESLLCIIHCQIWLPIAFHSYFAAQHQHLALVISGAHEAARLQFFPDFFDFSPAPKRTDLARLIGDAAPMKFSYVAAIELLR